MHTHVDPSGSAAWYAVVRGEKVFEVCPDSASRPLRLVLRPGSLMILPPGLPHRVTTTQWSVVVAGNFLPRHCWARVCRALQANDIEDSVRARELAPGTRVPGQRLV
jgi:cupin superfamily acireductone dioxygenase involved in methionine salvage